MSSGGEGGATKVAWHGARVRGRNGGQRGARDGWLRIQSDGATEGQGMEGQRGWKDRRQFHRGPYLSVDAPFQVLAPPVKPSRQAKCWITIA